MRKWLSTSLLPSSSAAGGQGAASCLHAATNSASSTAESPAPSRLVTRPETSAVRAGKLAATSHCERVAGQCRVKAGEWAH